MDVQAKSRSGIVLVPIESRLIANRKIFIEWEINADTAARYSVVGENPFSIIDAFRTESGENGNRVIERDYYDKRTGSREPRWKICDVQALMGKLSKTSGIARKMLNSKEAIQPFLRMFQL